MPPSRSSALAAVLAMALINVGCGEDDSDSAASPAGTRMHKGLMWQVAPPGGARIHEEAANYCATLSLGGFSDWRLPTISELRTQITGCAGREWGGACKVADPTCLSKTCHSASVCGHCKKNGGPDKGCYWQPGLWQGSCTDLWFYWTSSRFNNFADHYWVVRFQGGGLFDDGVVGFNEELGQGSVRCVRMP